MPRVKEFLSSLRSRHQIVYEAVNSGPEGYHPIGLWSDLDQAVAAIEERDTDKLDVCETLADEGMTIEIRQRKVGFCGAGPVVVSLEFLEFVNDAGEPEFSFEKRVHESA